MNDPELTADACATIIRRSLHSADSSLKTAVGYLKTYERTLEGKRTAKLRARLREVKKRTERIRHAFILLHVGLEGGKSK